MSNLESRLAAALQADLPPARDARFRLDVLVRIERARFRRRVVLAAVGATVVALLAAGSLPAVESWMTADVRRIWMSAGATATLSTLFGILLASPSAVKELGNCWPYLEDSSGQRWSRRPPRSREISCARLSLRADPEIKQTVLEERFVIPAARASDVRLAFVIPKQQPRYLRFWRPEETPP